jgi:hypothetical protein
MSDRRLAIARSEAGHAKLEARFIVGGRRVARAVRKYERRLIRRHWRSYCKSYC